MNPTQFQTLIKQILKEEVEKIKYVKDAKSNLTKRVPEVVHDKDYKKIVPHDTGDKSKYEYLSEMDKIVKDVNKSYMVVWDDHDDMSITTQGLIRFRITPKWNNNFCIEIMTRAEDRVYITGQNWDQVKDIVKTNLKELETNTDKAYDKSIKNVTDDQTPKPGKGMPQDDKPKILPLTNEPPRKEKRKNKEYTEDQTKKDEDLPEKEMKDIGEFKKQLEFKVQDPVKLRRRVPNTTLVVKQK